MTAVAIIGGSGLTSLTELENSQEVIIQTPYGTPSAPLVHGSLAEKAVVFLARHGSQHTIPPHQINYRANIKALKDAGVDYIIAIGAVGGINPAFAPQRLAIPDQIIDYTSARATTFFEEHLDRVVHIDFTHPFCEALRLHLINTSRNANLDILESGTYGATQGPRLETAAEIDKMERDGVDMVGMTGMPEAALAKELGMCYATCAICANWAAGRSSKEISMQEMEANLAHGMHSVKKLLREVLSSFHLPPLA